MSTREERVQVLRMIETGKITAEEGAKLLEALEQSDGPEGGLSSPGRPKWFRVRVSDKVTGKTKVNVNIPMGLVSVGMRMGARFAPEMSDVNMAELMQAVKAGASGKILEVDDEQDGEHVEIYVE